MIALLTHFEILLYVAFLTLSGFFLVKNTLPKSAKPALIVACLTYVAFYFWSIYADAYENYNLDFIDRSLVFPFLAMPILLLIKLWIKKIRSLQYLMFTVTYSAVAVTSLLFHMTIIQYGFNDAYAQRENMLVTAISASSKNGFFDSCRALRTGCAIKDSDGNFADDLFRKHEKYATYFDEIEDVKGVGVYKQNEFMTLDSLIIVHLKIDGVEDRYILDHEIPAAIVKRSSNQFFILSMSAKTAWIFGGLFAYLKHIAMMRKRRKNR